MSVLSLYIFRQLTQIFLILVGVLTGLVWVSQAIRFLNLVIEKGRSLGEFLLLTGYLIPSIMGLVAPTALFIATIFVLHRLNSDSELAVIQAAGGSQWRLLKPFVAGTVFVTIFVIFVNVYAMPHGLRAFREKLISVRTDLISTLVQEGQFVSPEAGLTVHIRSQDPANGDLLGLLFHDTRKSESRITYLAERARIVKSETGTSLLMYNGTFQRRRETAKDVDVVRFDEYTLDLDSFGPDRKVPYYQASEKFMSELFNPDPKDPIFLDHPGKIFAEIHERLSNPLYVLTMMLIAFIGLSEAKTNRMGRVWLIMGVLGLATGIRLLGATSVGLLVKTNALFPLAYAIPLMGILSTLTYLAYHNRAGSAYHTLTQDRAGRNRAAGSGGPASQSKNRQKSLKTTRPNVAPSPTNVPPQGPGAPGAPGADGSVTVARRETPPPDQARRQTETLATSQQRRAQPVARAPAGAPQRVAPQNRPQARPQSQSQNRTAPLSGQEPARRPDPHQALRHLAKTLTAPKPPSSDLRGSDLRGQLPPEIQPKSGTNGRAANSQGQQPLRPPSMVPRKSPTRQSPNSGQTPNGPGQTPTRTSPGGRQK